MTNTNHDIKFYGADWCGDCARAKIVFAKYGVEYEYIDIDKDEEAAKYVETVNGGNRSIPTIVINGEQTLVEPNENEIVEALGLTKR